MNQRAVDVAALFGGRGDLVFRYEDEVAGTRPALEQVFEGFTNDRLAPGPGNLAQVLKLVEILLDEYLAHVAMADNSP